MMEAIRQFKWVCVLRANRKMQHDFKELNELTFQWRLTGAAIKPPNAASSGNSPCGERFGKAETRFLQVIDRELKNLNL